MSEFNIPKAIAFSPITTTTLSILIDANKVYVTNIDAFPDLTAGELGIITFCDKVNLVSFDPADFETGTYTGKGSDGDGDFLSGVVRGVEGTARAWGANTYVSSYSSAYAWNVLRSRVLEHEGLDDAHGSVSSNTANKIVRRDASGRASVVDGSASTDIATKGQVDAKPDLGETSNDAYRGDRGKTAYDHSQNVTGAVHGAVSANTANMIVRRDSAGRASVVAGSASTDIATKGQLDSAGTSVNTVNTVMRRDASGRASVVDGSAVTDIATKGQVDAHADNNTGAVHGAASLATANMIIRRDASGRARVADPSDDADIATKGFVAPKIHNLVDTTNHPVSGLTTNHMLTALSSTTYGFTERYTMQYYDSFSLSAVATAFTISDLPTTGVFAWRLIGDFHSVDTNANNYVLLEFNGVTSNVNYFGFNIRTSTDDFYKLFNYWGGSPESHFIARFGSEPGTLHADILIYPGGEAWNIQNLAIWKTEFIVNGWTPVSDTGGAVTSVTFRHQRTDGFGTNTSFTIYRIGV